MVSIPQTKKMKKADITEVTQKTKHQKKPTVPEIPPRHEPSEEPVSISKSKHWKLLYASCPLGAAKPGNISKGSNRVGFSDEPRDSARYKGLCRNCKKRQDCTVPKPDGGIWRCEDYE